MPYFVNIVGIRASRVVPADALDGLAPPMPAVGDDEHTVSTIREALSAAAARVSGLNVDVVYDGDADWIDIGWVGLAGGSVRNEAVRLSRAADRFSEVPSLPAPEEALELDTDADGFIDALERISVWGEPDEDDRFLTLPFGYDGLDATLGVLARIANHVEQTSTRIVRIDGRHYELTLDRESGATLHPLHPWLDDASLRAWARSVLPEPGEAKSKKARARAGERFAPLDPARPLTTGSARRRLDAISDLVRPEIVREVDGIRITSWSKDPAPGAFDALCDALRDPSNAGEAMAEVRRALYAGLTDAADSPAVAAEVLEAALHTETEALRAHLYELLSRLDAPIAHRALAFGFRHDSDIPVRTIRAVIWRSPNAVADLVTHELVPAWSTEGADSRFCKRVLSMLESEHIPVAPEWLRGAPPELVRALTPRAMT